MIPKDASTPVPSSNLIVPAPPVESPSALPLWKISRLPVVLFTLAVTLVTFDPITDATFESVVPEVVIVTPFITKVCPLTTVVPEATDTTGRDVDHASDPTCTQVLLAVFL